MNPVYNLKRKIKIDNLVLEFPTVYKVNPYVEFLVSF